MKTEETEKQENGKIEAGQQLAMPEGTQARAEIVVAKPKAKKIRQSRKQAVAMVPADSDPMAEVMRFAIEKNADAEQLKGLVEVQIRWREYKAKEAFHTAFWHFKEEPELKILKDKIVDFESKRSGQPVKYRFAALDGAEDVLIPLLAKHGLTHNWRLTPKENGWTEVTCVLSHYLGHQDAGASLLGPPDQSGSKNLHQAIGSNASFLQRYTLCAACGVTPKNVDTDALVNGQNGQEAAPANGNGQNLVPVLEQSLIKEKEKQLRNCRSIDEMQKFWSSLTKEEAQALKTVKDECKAKITRGVSCQ